MLVTGHYVQRLEGPDGPELWRAPPIADRDQSYFLFGITRDQLADAAVSRSAACPRPEVRALAREFELPVADKSDSQDICFVPHGPLHATSSSG